ncbi:Type II toxin-antitoxin system HicB family antitoxin [Candidatus Magnetomoraceae bacterium gMMP-15]
MNTMTYKNYVAKINFDERDNILWGKVLGLKDSITFEGETVTDLIKDFHNAIDHYLADCKLTGRKPEKPYSDNFILTVGSEVHMAYVIAAEAEGKGLNQWATEILNKAACDYSLSKSSQSTIHRYLR